MDRGQPLVTDFVCIKVHRPPNVMSGSVKANLNAAGMGRQDSAFVPLVISKTAIRYDLAVWGTMGIRAI